MTDGFLDETAEDLFENAPCGYLSTQLDGTIVRVNRTFEDWVDLPRADLLGRRFQDLLSPGGRIYHETHYSPMLQMQGSVREIAVEIVRADGSRLPALVNSVLRRGSSDGAPDLIRTTVFDATERRRYEDELLAARRREHDIAHSLQRSLISGELPDDERLEIGVTYRPAERGAEAGGDWYDAFWLDDESIALVVGDVVGRGIGAAATMGQLRSAVRALALAGLGPGKLLDSLNEFAIRHHVGQMATVVYAELSLKTGGMHYACAGHPPPLLVGPGDSADFLWGGRSVPLDAFGSIKARVQGEAEMAPGSTLLLYTDGLIERRQAPLADGLDRFSAQATEQRELPVSLLASSLVTTFTDDETPDDVCVLGVRLST